jgi:hypothetical protein
MEAILVLAWSLVVVLIVALALSGAILAALRH